jgi:ferredoxin
VAEVVKVVVDWNLCEGNGLCERLVPEVFHVDDHDNLQLLDPTPPGVMIDRLQAAVDACPKTALRLQRGTDR